MLPHCSHSIWDSHGAYKFMALIPMRWLQFSTFGERSPVAYEEASGHSLLTLPPHPDSNCLNQQSSKAKVLTILAVVVLVILTLHFMGLS